MASPFAAAFKNTRRSGHSRRADAHGAKKKPAAAVDPEDERDPPIASSPPKRSSYGLASLTAADAEQYRTAGQSPEEELPAAPFPHRPIASPRRAPSRRAIRQDLASLDPPLLTRTPADAQPPGIHERHVSVLVTILHRSLLEGDYPRAEKAWSILLRTSLLGNRFDVRNHGRWGIGAEVLLQRDSSDPNATHDRHEDEHAGISGTTRPEHLTLFTNGGFQAAREYYELLCRAFPRRNFEPRTADATDFYPAMFGLWIAEVVERRRTAYRQLEQSQNDKDRSESPSLAGFQEGPRSPFDEAAEEHVETHDRSNTFVHESEARLAIDQAELNGARAIAARIDELRRSPPYDKDLHLLRLRSMVSYWIADLLPRLPTTADGLAAAKEGSGQSSPSPKKQPSEQDQEREKADGFLHEADKIRSGA